MKKGFPNKILWFPIGWKNLGEIEGYASKRAGYIMYESHTYCGTIAKVGTENGKLFKYCPKCLIKN